MAGIQDQVCWTPMDRQVMYYIHVQRKRDLCPFTTYAVSGLHIKRVIE